MFNYLLIISPSETSLLQEKYCNIDHTLGRFVNAIDGRYHYTPLHIDENQDILKFWRARGGAYLCKNMPLTFADILPRYIYCTFHEFLRADDDLGKWRDILVPVNMH